MPSGFGSTLFLPSAAAQPPSPAAEYQVHPHYRTPRSLDAVLRKVQPGLDDFVAEKYHERVVAILERLTGALLKSPNATAEIESALAATLNANSPIPADSQRVRTSSFLKVSRNKFSPERQFDRATWIRDWRSALSQLSTLQAAEFQITEIQLNDVSNGVPSSIQTHVRVELVGSGNEFHREHRIGNWDLTWSLGTTGELKITKWLILDETRSQSLSPVFRDIAQQTLGRNSSFAAQFIPSVDHWRTVLDGASGIDIYGHNGVSFADIDGDGFDDLYICQPSGLPNRLFRNRGDGTLEDITESCGLGLLDNTACALFADFSNSGRQDAIIVRTSGPLLFLNDGHGKFQLKPDAFQFANEPQGTFTGAAVADYDRDGWLDIYFCLYIYYQGTDQYRYPTPYYDANNGPPNFMFRNNRDGTFRDVTKETNLDRNNTRFSFCCGWNDYNGDGWPDLYVVNDFGRKNLYRNDGNGTFTDVAPEAGVEDVGAGMSVCWLDADNDGKQDLYVADMWTAAGVRISQQDAFKKDANSETRAFYRKHAMGNSLFHNRDAKRFEDITTKSGTGMGRWAWCSDSWDFDHDGYADIYVTNGMITGPAPVRDDLNSFFWRQVVANSPAEPRSNYNYDQAWNAVNELIRADGTWSGYERNVFYANNGDGTFSDVSGAVDLDFVEDCRSFALADLDHDGRLEVVLKTRNSPQLRVLKNVLKDLSPAITFRLTGKKSNRDAIGARVTVDTGTTHITRVVQAGSGFLAQHSKELHFGLGQTKQTVNATIYWPGGTTQNLTDLPVNHRIWIDEGASTPRPESFQSPVTNPPTTVASQQAAQTTPASFGTWLLAPVEAPEFYAQYQNAKTQIPGALRGKPTLLFFWAESPDSNKALAELNAAHSSLWMRGLQLVAINADEPPPGQSAGSAAPHHQFSFPVVPYDADLIAIYNILYRSLYDRHRDLTLPTSFLIDAEGLIVKVYQGPVAPNQILDDLKNIPNTAEARMQRGLPFPGVATTTEFTRNYLSYGSIFFERGFTNEAQHFLQLALRDDPDNSEALYGIGSIYLQQNKGPEARATFERVIKLPQRYPGTLPNAWNNLGLLSAREGRTDEAIQQFQQALQIDPDHFIALENLGNAYRQAKRWDDAKATLERALQFQPDSAEANYALGMVYAQTDDANRAYDYLQKALTLKRDYPEALNNLGVLYLRKNQPNDAEASFKEAIRVAPSFQQSYFNLARLYAIEGNNTAARRVLSDLLQQHPGDPQIERALSQLP